jgi:hypothetical protein
MLLSCQSDRNHIVVVSQMTPAWMANLQTGYADDSQAQQLITEMCASDSHWNADGFTLQDGLLRYKGHM